ncbi:MAG: hypothetical protein GC179_26150 [Anaerolineaceae bacterium]|nr:hypothetical protein [Anaerolineaceae bacterium]
MKIRMMGLMLGLLLLGACSTASPVKQFTQGDELAFYDFTSPSSFEVGLYGNNTARLEVSDGVYNIQLSTGDNTLYYGQWGDTLSDVLIDVEATQTSSDLNSTYGVMCRMRGTVGQTVKASPEATAESTDAAASDTIMASADSTAEATSEATAEPTQKPTAEATAEATPLPASDINSNNGDGYLFMIQGNGRYAILRSQGHKITPLVNWTSSDVIKMGAAQNRIKAICAGSYLALYVNNQFLADTSDTLYTKGQVGLVGASAGRTGMTVTFDNLAVYQPKPG